MNFALWRLLSALWKARLTILHKAVCCEILCEIAFAPPNQVLSSGRAFDATVGVTAS